MKMFYYSHNMILSWQITLLNISSIHTACINVHANRLIFNQIVRNEESPIVCNTHKSLNFDNQIRQNRSIIGR